MKRQSNVQNPLEIKDWPRISKRSVVLAVVALTVSLGLAILISQRLSEEAFALTITWDGGGDGSSWSDPDNWNPNSVPTADDDVTIDSNVTVVLAGATTINSLTLGNVSGSTSPVLNFTYDAIQDGPLVVDNGNVTFYTGSTVTHAAPSGDTITARINIDVQEGSMSIRTGSTITAFAKGYSGGITGHLNGWGPGGGGGSTTSGAGGAGGGHGALGANGSVGVAALDPYGYFHEPTSLGSGGGAGDCAGGKSGRAGGGSIKLSVAGDLQVAGNITSSGDSASGSTCGDSRSGGGAGGSIWIIASGLEGSGTITANGGNGGNIDGRGGAGSGGRVFITYSSSTFNGVATVAGGTIPSDRQGQNGSLVFNNLGSNLLTINASQWWIPENSNTFSEAFPQVTSLHVTNNATLKLESGNRTAEDESGFGWTIDVDEITIDAGSSITAKELGYKGGVIGHLAGWGPAGGAGSTASSAGGAGGGHGGLGANSATQLAATNVYGSIRIPIALGSGGGVGDCIGGKPGRSGGGALRFLVGGTFTLNGAVDADGGSGSICAVDGRSGGGAGGSILISASSIAGDGTISANGGGGGTQDGAPGAGGGGRVVVSSAINTFSGQISALGGNVPVARPGENGTVVLINSSTKELAIGQSQRWVPTATTTFEDLFGDVNDLLITNNSTLSLDSGNKTALDESGYGWVLDLINITINSGSSLSATELGYRGGITTTPFKGYGPSGGNGSSSNGCGGSGGTHAGVGAAGNCTTADITTYGSATKPVKLGSGGGVGDYTGPKAGRAGGGAIKLTATGEIAVNGSIQANGGSALAAGCGDCRSGGGAGGSIWIDATLISGSGTITATGGNGGNADARGGAGGGGRIAVYYTTDDFAGTYSVDGGTIPATRQGTAGTNTLSSKPLIENLAQYDASGDTLIATGEIVHSTSLLFKTDVTYAFTFAEITPQLEVRPVGTNFTNTATHTGDAVSFPGSAVEVSVLVDNLVDLTNYHWQFRVCDELDLCSDWISYGGNAETEPDFIVLLNQPPVNPTIPGSSPYISGVYTNISSPTLSFSQSDPDGGDQVKYQIQIDNTSDFSSPVVDYTSAYGSQGATSFTVGQPVGSGTYAVGSESQTLTDGSYYWRIKTIDEDGEESEWVVATGTPSFILDTVIPDNIVTTSVKSYAGSSVVIEDDSVPVWLTRPDFYVTWSASGDTSGLKGYCMYLGTDPDGDPATQKGLLGSSPISTTGTTCQFIAEGTNIDLANSALRGDPWVTSGTEGYYIKIRPITLANNVGVEDTESSTFRFYYDATAPNNVTTISVSSGSHSSIADMHFYWPTSGPHAASDADSGILGYQYAINSTDVWRGVEEDAATGMAFIPPDYPQPFSLDPEVVGDVISVGSNVLYFRTVDISGNVSNFTTAPLEYGGAAPSFAPGSNVTVTPTTNSENRFAFSWPAASPGEDRTIETYYYMINTPPPALLSTITSNSATYLATTERSISERAVTNARKGNNTIYVVAVDDNGNYSQSNYITGSFILDSELPDPPGALVVTDASIKSASLWRATIAWSAPEYKGTGDLTYIIQRSLNGTNWTTVDSTTGSAYLDTLSTSRLYYWRVASTDTSDQSINNPSFSNAVTLTPKGVFTTPPSLTSGPTVSSVTTKKATVGWTTNRTSDSRVAIGTTQGKYLEDETANSTQVTDHVVRLSNLSPDTTYYYQAKWTDEDGNTGTSIEKSFKTDPPPRVQNVSVRNIGIDSALIQFTTSGVSEAMVYYGLSTAFGGVKSVATSTLESTYSVQLDGLQDGAKHYFRINTRDAEGDEYEGTTLDFATMPRPRVSNVRVQQVANSAQSSVQVSWDSNTPISSIVTYYPESNPEQARDAVDIELVDGEHKMLVPGLLPETTYILTVRGRDRIGNEAVSDSLRFTTASDTRPPKISNFVVEGANVSQAGSSTQISSSQFIVTWTTDEPATSQVEFGEGAGQTYSQVTQEDQTLKYNHLVVVSGLTPSKVYHMRAISKDSAGNLSRSVDTVSITPKANDSAFDLVITNLKEAFGFLAGL